MLYTSATHGVYLPMNLSEAGFDIVGHREIPTEGCPGSRAASMGCGVKGCSLPYEATVCQASVFIGIPVLPKFYPSPSLSPPLLERLTCQPKEVRWSGAGCSCHAYQQLPLQPMLVSPPWFSLGPGVGLSLDTGAALAVLRCSWPVLSICV